MRELFMMDLIMQIDVSYYNTFTIFCNLNLFNILILSAFFCIYSF